MPATIRRLLTCFFLLVSTYAMATSLSAEQFTTLFAQKASTAVKTVHFTIVQPLQLNATDAHGAEHTVFLQNVYTQYTANPAQLPSILRSQIRAIQSSTQILTNNHSQSLLAVIKPADYLVAVKQQLLQAGAGDKEIRLLYEHLNDELDLFYVIDSESGMRMATKEDLQAMQVSPQSMHALAVKNLSAYFAKQPVNIHRLADVGTAKVYVVSLDENYEASVLLLNQYWNKQQFPVAGDLVVFVPARNVVLVTGTEEAEGLRIATYLGQRGFNELGYAISPNGYRYQGGSWVPYHP